MPNIERLRDFVVLAAKAVETNQTNEAAILAAIKPSLHELLRHDDFLDETYTRPHPQYYQQYLLYGDALEKLSIVSFVWGPGQKTPVHNHRTWGLVGVLRGAELNTPYHARDGQLTPGQATRLAAGEIEAVSPRLGDIHQVSNAYDDRVSISIHVYGGNIGRINREVFVPETGAVKRFVSGYAPCPTPNLWAN